MMAQVSQKPELIAAFPPGMLGCWAITEALQVFGGNGLGYEYPVEKQVRDVRASLIEDGTTEVLSLFAAERL